MNANHMTHATYGGSLLAVVGGVGLSEILAAGGLIVAIAGFVVNLIYRHRQDRRDARRLARDLVRPRDLAHPARDPQNRCAGER